MVAGLKGLLNVSGSRLQRNPANQTAPKSGKSEHPFQRILPIREN
jgi:hypothetical protein